MYNPLLYLSNGLITNIALLNIILHIILVFTVLIFADGFAIKYADR